MPGRAPPPQLPPRESCCDLPFKRLPFVFSHALRPFIAAILGFFAGLVAGALAEIVLFPLCLFAVGQSHPLAVLDESFRSHPLGALAVGMIAGYFATAFLGAAAAYKIARGRNPRQTRPASIPFAAPIGKVWRATSEGKRTVIVALPILILAIQTITVRERQAVLRHAATQATAEKRAPLVDHRHIFYTSLSDKAMIARWEFASFLITFGSLAYVFQVFRLSEFLSVAFTSLANRRGRIGPVTHLKDLFSKTSSPPVGPEQSGTEGPTATRDSNPTLRS
jgi:amino acid transporter